MRSVGQINNLIDNHKESKLKYLFTYMSASFVGGFFWALLLQLSTHFAFGAHSCIEHGACLRVAVSNWVDPFLYGILSTVLFFVLAFLLSALLVRLNLKGLRESVILYILSLVTFFFVFVFLSFSIDPMIIHEPCWLSLWFTPLGYAVYSVVVVLVSTKLSMVFRNRSAKKAYKP